MSLGGPHSQYERHGLENNLYLYQQLNHGFSVVVRPSCHYINLLTPSGFFTFHLV